MLFRGWPEGNMMRIIEIIEMWGRSLVVARDVDQ